MRYSTIREILLHAAKKFGDGDAVRYKVKKTKLKQNLMRSLPLTVKAFPGAW